MTDLYFLTVYLITGNSATYTNQIYILVVILQTQMGKDCSFILLLLLFQ